eukprot:TRINITY_DN3328_c0_g2_i1.p1 TRINITY_DN3328_c0_g2~~TRINITY_DN3328_c0_g2_i1.p1  ORF type:complete len:1282 (+),score=395.93 TRINITY_DN3328_c0_g2_i1:108-3953(+)
MPRMGGVRHIQHAGGHGATRARTPGSPVPTDEQKEAANPWMKIPAKRTVTPDQPRTMAQERELISQRALAESRESPLQQGEGGLPGQPGSHFGNELESESGDSQMWAPEEDDYGFEEDWEVSNTGVPIEAILKHLNFRQLSSQLYGDFLKYIPFLIMFVFFFLGVPGTAAFRDITSQHYVVGVLKDKLMGNFVPNSHIEKYVQTAANSGDWYNWAIHVMVPNIWRCDFSDRSFNTLTAQGQNYLLGAMRIRTLRVRNDSCPVNAIFTGGDEEGSAEPVPCYGQWSTSGEESTPRMGFPDPARHPHWLDLVEPVTSTADAVALAELRLYNFGRRVNLDDAEAWNPWGSNRDASNPFGAEARYAIDDDRATFWLDYDRGPLVVKLAEPLAVTAYTFTLADGPSLRDPVQWRLEGSHTGGDNDYEWSLLHHRWWDYIPSGDCEEGPCSARRATQPLFSTEDSAASMIAWTYIRFVPTAFAVQDSGSYHVNWEPPLYRTDPPPGDNTECEPPAPCPVQMAELRMRGHRDRSRGPAMDAGHFSGALGVGAIAFVPGGAPRTPAPPPPPQSDELLGNGTVPNKTVREIVYSLGDPVDDLEPDATIDGYASTDWVSMDGSALYVQYPELVTLKHVTWTTSSSHQWRDPVSWRLEGTTDDPTSGSARWRVLWEVVRNMSVPLGRRRQLPWTEVNPANLLFTTFRFTATEVRGYPAEEELAYRYRGCAGMTTDELSGYVVGDIAAYHCGGYEVIIPFNASCDSARRAVWALGSRNYPFLDNTAMRFITIEFFVYTPQVNAFTSVKVFAEEASSGGWNNKWLIRTFSIFTDRQMGQTIFDFFFLAFVLYFWLRYALDWRREVRRGRVKWYLYPIQVWNILEFGNLLTFVVVYIMKYIWWGYSVRAKNILFPYAAIYPTELDKLAALYIAQVFANAINTIITFLKFLKYVRLNSKLNLLTRTIALAKEQLVSTLIIFLYFVFCYTLCGVALYGTQLGEYRNLFFAMSALSRMLLGDFDYVEMRDENRVLTAFFFWSYVLLTFFVMLQFLIAILGTNFSAISGDAGNEAPFQEQMMRAWVAIKRFFRPARIKRGLKLWVQGNSRADVLDRCITSLEAHWKLMRTCSECGVPVSCVCSADCVESSLHVKEHCGECGATSLCHATGAYHPTFYSDMSSRIVYRGELRDYFGPTDYDLLEEGCNYVDDLWDEVLWDFQCELRFDPETQKEETEGFVEKCVRDYFIGTDGKALGALSEVDVMDTKFRAFELQIQNLLSLMQSERKPEVTRSRPGTSA